MKIPTKAWFLLNSLLIRSTFSLSAGFSNSRVADRHHQRKNFPSELLNRQVPHLWPSHFGATKVPQTLGSAQLHSEREGSNNVQDLPEFKPIFKRLNDHSSRKGALLQLLQSELPFTVLDYKSLLKAACQLGRQDLVGQLLQEIRILSQAIIPEIYDMGLKISVSRNYWRLIIFLLEDMLRNGFIPPVESFNAALCTCCGTGNVRASFELYQMMKKYHIKPDIKSYTLLMHIAVRSGDVSMALNYLNEAESLQLQPDLKYIRQAHAVCLLAKEYTRLKTFYQRSAEAGIDPELDAMATTALKVLLDTEDPFFLDQLKEQAARLNLSDEQVVAALTEAFFLVFRNTCQFTAAIDALELLQRSYGISLGMRAFSSVVAEALRANEHDYVFNLVKEVEQQGLDVGSEVYVRLIKYCACQKDFKRVLQFYKTLKSCRISQGVYDEPNFKVFECVIKAKVALLDFNGAIALFYERKDTSNEAITFCMYADILHAFSRTRRWKSVVAHFQEMQRQFTFIESEYDTLFWVSCYTIAIRAAGKLQELGTALQFLQEMKTLHKLPRSLSTWTTAIGACATTGKANEAFEVFEEMLAEVEKDTLTSAPFNALMVVCRESNELDRAFEVFRKMEDFNVGPDTITYSILVSICGQKSNWNQIKYLFQKCPDSIINGFPLLTKHHSLQEIHTLFTDLFEQNPNNRQLVLGYLSSCRSYGGDIGWEAAKNVWAEMKQRNIQPTQEMYFQILQVYQKNLKSQEAFEIFLDMIENGNQANEELRQGMYRMILKLLTSTHDYERLLEVIERSTAKGFAFDYIVYSAAINACSRLGNAKDILKYYEEMKSSPYALCQRDYWMLINCLSENNAPYTALEVLADMKLGGLLPNMSIYTTLFFGLSKAGDHKQALNVFEDFKASGRSPDEIGYTNILQICSCGSLGDEAEKYFQEMKTQGLKASSVAYNYLLKALVASSKWEQIHLIANEMKATENIQLDKGIYYHLKTAVDKLDKSNSSFLEFHQTYRILECIPMGDIIPV